MMEKLIGNILLGVESSGLIDKDDEEVYRFGLECMFLKLIHYSSYLFIGYVLHMMIPMLVSAAVFMPLRSKSGGYHAKTRLGCYLFSCSVVALVCMLNKIIFAEWIVIIALLVTNSIVLLFAPVENYNRILSSEEKQKFRRQTLIMLLVVNVVIVLAILKEWYVYQWLADGLLAVAILILIGKVNSYRETIQKKHEK